MLRFLEIYQEAADLYGLIHARFILTPKGFFTIQRINSLYFFQVWS